MQDSSAEEEQTVQKPEQTAGKLKSPKANKARHSCIEQFENSKLKLIKKETSTPEVKRKTTVKVNIYILIFIYYTRPHKKKHCE